MISPLLPSSRRYGLCEAHCAAAAVVTIVVVVVVVFCTCVVLMSRRCALLVVVDMIKVLVAAVAGARIIEASVVSA